MEACTDNHPEVNTPPWPPAEALGEAFDGHPFDGRNRTSDHALAQLTGTRDHVRDVHEPEVHVCETAEQ
jgi:hypothetical protein